ncbi:CCC motif membrane protein [Aquimarina gracilis]|uniref:CCC motif membrane protein n=1 Tax=Aquimarina gracilis TaxID=874422 RepID=A0ABU6A1F8_9FLAO|nr:CCC motif membrane protein [Aquimarina gracilis]MEB3347931.1 CCC motif membrane protein [Aquimarina gracilis]
MEKQTLPNSTLILVFGILSIVGCCCYGIGIIFAVIAIVMAKKATALYTENPELYEGYNNVKTGKILSIIGIVLGAIYLAYVIFIFATVGLEGYQEMIEEITRGAGA